MRWVRRFAALPARERWLLLKAWALLVAVRAMLRVCRYQGTRRLLGRLGRRPVPRLVLEPIAPARIARLCEIASHFVWSGRHCLTRALVLETLLRRRGVAARIEFGVARGPARELQAHAWVVCDGHILIGGEGAERFTNLAPPGPRTAPADG